MTAKGATTTATPVAIYRLILPIVFWLGAWGLLQPVAAQEIELLLLQTRGRLYDLALSPDRSVLAVGGDNNAVHLWNPTNGEHLRTLDASRQGNRVTDQQALSGYIASVAFHPDKPLLATGGTDGAVRLWDYQSGSAVYTLSDHRGPVRAVAFHPAGGVLASAGGDGIILLWNINNGQRLGVLRAHQDTVHALAFSDDGNRLASAGEDKTVRLWDFASGRLLHTLSGHRDRVVALTFASTTLASAGQDGTVRVWQQDTGDLERVLTAHRDAVTDLAFQPGLGQLASVGLDGRMLLWELSADTPSEPVPPQEHPIAAVSLVGEDTAATAGLDGVVRLWNLKEGRSRLALTLLPENQWLSYDPSSLYYNASARGDHYGMLRFPGLEQTLFPLHYYRDKLFQPARLDGLQQPGSPVSQPALAPRIWRLRWERLDYRLLAAGLAGILTLVLLVVLAVFLLRRRHRQLPIAHRCLTEAGFQRIKQQGPLLSARHNEDRVLLLPWSQKLADGELISVTSDPAQTASALYLVHDQSLMDIPPPDPSSLAALATRTEARLIPLWYPQMAIALAKGISQELFEEQEHFYRQRDPYLPSPPRFLLPAGHFFDRKALLETLTDLLAQGRHVGIFGLQNIGKTALSARLAQQLSQPTILVRCQELMICAEAVYVDILGQFRALLTARGIGRLPKLPMGLEAEQFQSLFVDLHRLAVKRAIKQPVVVMLDGMDRFMPSAKMPGYEAVLAEYTQLLSTLTRLAETHRSLVLLVNAERPEANRRTNLSALAGENPLYQNLYEVHLGPLEAAGTIELVRQLGARKGITWQAGTAERIYHLSAGHPWITLHLASDFCRQGQQTTVDLAGLERREMELLGMLDDHAIGTYYREGVWPALSQAERQLTEQILQAGSQGLAVTSASSTPVPAACALEELGLIERRQDRLLLVGELFGHWLKQHLGMDLAVEYRNPLL